MKINQIRTEIKYHGLVTIFVYISRDLRYTFDKYCKLYISSLKKDVQQIMLVPQVCEKSTLAPPRSVMHV